METALTASITGSKTINALATPSTKRLTNPTTLLPIWPLKRPVILDLYPCNSFLSPKPRLRFKNIELFLIHCSTKPNTDKDNAMDQNSTSERNPKSNIQKPATPTSNQALSSSNSSFSRGLVFDLGPKNSWDSVEIGSPVVKRFLGDEEERWYMWYHGWSSSGNLGLDAVGLAVSSNGIHWERGGGPIRSSADVGLVMSCSKDWWAFDTQSIRPCEVVIMSSAKVRANSAVYWLYYTGFSSEKVEFLDDSLEFTFENPENVNLSDNGDDGNSGIGKIYQSLPGLAMSQDGRHWARIEGEHHSGALFDVGLNGEWDSMFIAAPHVVFHGSGDLRMFYHSFDVEKAQFAIGIARSRDGMKWVKLAKIIGGGPTGCFDEFGVLNASVVRNRKDGKYVMAYEGVAADGRRSIGLAVSLDGLKDWRRVQDDPVLRQSQEDRWDNKGVGSPCLVQMDGDADEWRLYYRGIGKGGGRV
ncbi:unnamed protein product [Ilex paraguariensis]|uniref:Arabinanase/levansucrase/invertase n=1 Tax=Ilex paraguariensis TaxID=185542 RepID=A0ABC8R6Q7_9AQUA